MKPVRQCKNCLAETQTVCRHVFGVYWCVKSGDGEGCDHPMDGVAEAWHKAGWGKTGARVEELAPKKADLPAEPLPPLSDDDY